MTLLSVGQNEVGELVPTTRGGAVAARLAHNQEVAGSSPAPATISILTSVNSEVFFVPQNNARLLA